MNEQPMPEPSETGAMNFEEREHVAHRKQARFLALVDMCLRQKPEATPAEIKAWIAALD